MPFDSSTVRCASSRSLLRRITALAVLAGLVGAARVTLNQSVAAAEQARPNVVLIMSDDQGWGDLAVHGNPAIQTPVLDRLHSESVRFERFFVSPVCAPTRASLLTGRYDVRTGVSGVTGRREVMRADEVTLAEVLGPAGYATGCFGKWHNGSQYPNHPIGQGFDEFFGFTAGHWNDYFDTSLQHVTSAETLGRRVDTRGFITDVITDAAISFIEQHQDSPFFCYVPYNAPHTPWQVPDKWFDRYRHSDLDPATQSAYALIENVDHNVGRILNCLADQQLDAETIVIFLTDNGPNGKRYNGGMRGNKGSVHEGGVRVPLLIRWTQQLQPHTVTQVAAHVDLLPTLADLCNVKFQPHRPLDGRSLVPLLQDKAVDWPDRQLFTWREGRGSVRGAVRTQQYRFVREQSDQLYDLQADPGQQHDIAEQQPDVLRKLQSAFDSFQAEVAQNIEQVSAIPVGHPGVAEVPLPAVEAELHGQLKFANGQGWAHDWVTGWTDPQSRLVWQLDVAEPGDFAVLLDYACETACRGATVRVSSQTHTIQRAVDSDFTSSPVARPERIMPEPPRLTREFATLNLGSLSLPAGPNTLTVTIPAAAADTVIDVGGIRLQRVE